MKTLLWIFFMPFCGFAQQTIDMSKIRSLYQRAAEVKQDALQLNQLLLPVESDAAPVMLCYKGAGEMMQAKYTFNPIVKLEKLNNGKALIKKAFCRDTLNLEMRFIRFSIQSNLPAFLGYHDELEYDKHFMLSNTKGSKDEELKAMIFNYLSTLPVISPAELKQLKN